MAVVEKLTGVRRHTLARLMTAERAPDHREFDEFSHYSLPFAGAMAIMRLS